jgi:hypothetical protein
MLQNDILLLMHFHSIYVHSFIMADHTILLQNERLSSQGVNFINVLQAAFAFADPECVKKRLAASLSPFHFWDLHT